MSSLFHHFFRCPSHFSLIFYSRMLKAKSIYFVLPRSALILSNVGLPMVLKFGPNRLVQLVQLEIEHYSNMVKIPKTSENQPKIGLNQELEAKLFFCPSPVLKSWVYLDPKGPKQNGANWAIKIQPRTIPLLFNT